MLKLQGFLLILLISSNSFGQPVRTKLPSPISWTNATGWSPTGVPLPGEKVIIPAGVSVAISSNLNFTSLFIDLYGTLTLGNNRSLKLNSPSSYINVQATGSIEAANNNNNNSQIIINSYSQFVGNASYNTNGGSKGLIKGPALATGAGPDFQFGIVLPVKIAGVFLKKNGHSNVIYWDSHSNTAADLFQVERSNDAATWSVIGVVKQTYDHLDKYQFVDETVPRGRTYYRVRTIADNGQAEVSATVVAQDQTSGTMLRVSPNPANGIIRISAPGNTAETKMPYHVYNVSGQPIASGTISTDQSSLSLDVSNWPSGGYCLVVTESKGQKSAVSIQVTH